MFDDIGNKPGFVVIFPQDLLNNEAIIEPPQFTLHDSVVKYSVAPDVVAEITDQELMDTLDAIFSKNPALVTRLNKDFDNTIQALQEVLEKDHKIVLNLREVYNGMPKVKDFIDLVSVGIVVGPGYTNAVPFIYKLFVMTKNSMNSINIRRTNLGMVWKNLPIIKEVTSAEINSVCSRFFPHPESPELRDTKDYYKYFTKTVPNRQAVVEIKEALNYDNMDKVALAQELLENTFDQKFVQKLVKSGVSKKRINEATVLAKLMK